MAEKRPQWKRMSQAELERERARIRAKERDLRERLKKTQSKSSARSHDELKRVTSMLQAQIDGMAATADALLHRAPIRR
ncbi:MAG: hypothetical protein IV097_21465 [Burkholderiaceae bacterium]|nr:hypothetical protein [Burkholderiaceae bacterium]